MGRPAMPPGTARSIRIYKIAGGWRARASIRDYASRTRDIERVGPTKAAIRDRTTPNHRGGITPDTPVAALAEIWFNGLPAHPVGTGGHDDGLPLAWL